MENNITASSVSTGYIHLVSSAEDSQRSQRTITATCEVCGENAFSCEEVLEAQGWGLYRDVQLCPIHEEMA